MASVRICGKDVPYAFDARVVDPVRRQAAVDTLLSMAAFLTGVTDPELVAVFSLTDSVMFFENNILSDVYEMDRSFMDLPNRQFNWKLSEFLDPNHSDCSRASYYYHDAFHISQFVAAGDYPEEIDEQAQWEVDANAAQIAAVEKMDCGQYLIDFLRNHSKAEIVARLQAGVGLDPGQIPRSSRL
jgi:hypothetical protein